MKKGYVKIIRLSLALALIMSVLLSFVGFESKCETLRDNVLRLHIIANSDSFEDQNLKYKIRDEITALGLQEFENCTTLQEAMAVAEKALPIISDTANRVISENGFQYTAEVTLSDTYFSTRVYDDFTLPAGVYTSVCVKLGKAEGKNWWCVMFPAVCVSAAGAELGDAIEDDAVNIAENAQNYRIRFKIVEVFEKIKKNLLKI